MIAAVIHSAAEQFCGIYNNKIAGEDGVMVTLHLYATTAAKKVNHHIFIAGMQIIKSGSARSLTNCMAQAVPQEHIIGYLLKTFVQVITSITIPA